jgi:light-harvesting protein B-800-850 alpha chain
MNQGRIWCVVSPNVGLPLLLGSVTVIAFIVHASVMTHTTWMSNYWQGAAKPKVADAAAPATSGSAAAYAVTVLPGATANAQPSFVITITPNAAPANAVAAASAERAAVDVADKGVDPSTPAVSSATPSSN